MSFCARLFTISEDEVALSFHFFISFLVVFFVCFFWCVCARTRTLQEFFLVCALFFCVRFVCVHVLFVFPQKVISF